MLSERTKAAVVAVFTYPAYIVWYREHVHDGWTHPRVAVQVIGRVDIVEGHGARATVDEVPAEGIIGRYEAEMCRAGGDDAATRRRAWQLPQHTTLVTIGVALCRTCLFHTLPRLSLPWIPPRR